MAKPAGKTRILVMDYETGVRKVAGHMLKHIDYQDVEFAVEGAEAIEMYRAAMQTGSLYNAVILDLTIPGGMGGEEAVKGLLKIAPGVKAAVYSRYAKDPIFSTTGITGFVEGPSSLIRSLNSARPYRM